MPRVNLFALFWIVIPSNKKCLVYLIMVDVLYSMVSPVLLVYVPKILLSSQIIISWPEENNNLN